MDTDVPCVIRMQQYHVHMLMIVVLIMLDSSVLNAKEGGVLSLNMMR